MKRPDFSEFPTLSTSRFTLRKLSLNDAEVIYQLRSIEEVAVLTGRKPCASLDEATAYLKKIENLINNNECIFWGVSYKESTALIGAICLWNFDLADETVEIGYELLPQFQGKGIMAEVVARIVEYGFDAMGVKTIVAFPSGKNPASIKLLEKTGFKLAPGNYKHTHTDVEAMLSYIISIPG